MIKLLRAKLHGIRVTGSDLNYHGSISLDPDFCEQAGLLPTEFVEIWNKNSGARIKTYVIHGQSGSNCCILNGAAARTRQVGDELIIAATEYAEISSLNDRYCKVLTFDHCNNVSDEIGYRVFIGNNKRFEMQIDGESEK